MLLTRTGIVWPVPATGPGRSWDSCPRGSHRATSMPGTSSGSGSRTLGAGPCPHRLAVRFGSLTRPEGRVIIITWLLTKQVPCWLATRPEQVTARTLVARRPPIAAARMDRAERGRRAVRRDRAGGATGGVPGDGQLP